jgi:hypothetical protein
MPRHTKFYDVPVTFNTREKLRKKKGSKTYDDFLNEIMNMDLGM